MNDPFSVLGVPKDASRGVIRRAYIRLALDNHPDRNDSHEASARFREVQEAYDALSGRKARPEERPTAEEIGAARREMARRVYETFVESLSGKLGSERAVEVDKGGVRVTIKIGRG